MRQQVIDDQVNLVALGLVGHDVGQECDELCRRMAFSRLPDHFARLGVKRGVQGQRPMTEVLKPVSFDAPRRKRQHRILAVKCLDGGLLIHADHRRVLRRIQIQPDHLSGLGLELWVVGDQKAFKSTRLDTMLDPDAGHRHVRAVTEFGGQLARGPVRRPVSRFVVGCPRQHACFDPISYVVELAPGVAGEQPRQPISGKSLAPTSDVTVAAVKFGANLVQADRKSKVRISITQPGRWDHNAFVER